MAKRQRPHSQGQRQQWESRHTGGPQNCLQSELESLSGVAAHREANQAATHEPQGSLIFAVYPSPSLWACLTFPITRATFSSLTAPSVMQGWMTQLLSHFRGCLRCASWGPDAVDSTATLKVLGVPACTDCSYLCKQGYRNNCSTKTGTGMPQERTNLLFLGTFSTIPVILIHLHFTSCFTYCLYNSSGKNIIFA